MLTIHFNPTRHVYSAETRTFTVSERDVQFATEYRLINPVTGIGRVFRFLCSTGPEFEPTTRWIYETEDGLKLEVCNDPEITRTAAANYLAAKLRN